jgi:Ca2+-binding RTX toxin-like protein
MITDRSLTKRAGLLAVLWLALFPGSALGASAHVAGLGVPDRRILFYEASPGEANQVEIAIDLDTATATIHDSGATITAGAGCTSVTVHEVTCFPVDYQVFMNLADGADVLEVTNQGGVELDATGGTGNDEMTVLDESSAHLSGNAGNDVLSGTHALLNGGGGNDTLTSVLGGVIGAGGDDILTANTFHLWGGPGDDQITGGDAENHIVAGSGDDTVAAGGGRDFVSPGPGSNTVDGGPGRDLVTYWDVRTPMLVTLAAGRATHLTTSHEDLLASFEDVRGTPLNDRLIGDGQDNVLRGRGGADDLRGGGGSDQLWGKGGDDFLVGGAGPDRLHGGDGDDRLNARDGVRDLVAGDKGHDAARVDRALDELKSIERLF